MKLNLPKLAWGASATVFGLMVLAAGAAVVARPDLVAVENAPSLEDTVPKRFGDWTLVPDGRLQVGTSTGDEPNMDQPYDQTVMRSYVNGRGQVVMLALAWGQKQQQEVKVHRPDLCYVAQGYQVRSLTPATFPLGQPGVRPTGKHMVAFGGRNGEAVSYWIRIGSLYSEDAWATRLHILKQGFGGHIPDGILVRASQPIADPAMAAASWPVLDQFLNELVAAVPPATRALLVR